MPRESMAMTTNSTLRCAYSLYSVQCFSIGSSKMRNTLLSNLCIHATRNNRTYVIDLPFSVATYYCDSLNANKQTLSSPALCVKLLMMLVYTNHNFTKALRNERTGPAAYTIICAASSGHSSASYYERPCNMKNVQNDEKLNYPRIPSIGDSRVTHK